MDDTVTESREQKAEALFRKGYNCSQAVAGAFCDELDIEFDTLMKISSSFGAGIGDRRGTCGAITGMCIVVGLKYGTAIPDDTLKKSEGYRLIRSMADEFKARNGSIICRELLGLMPVPPDVIVNTVSAYRQGTFSQTGGSRASDNFPIPPCLNLIKIAVRILEKQEALRDSKKE